ncbi:MAG: 30S ribosome-binding factor RbfA [Defluviicoccus sp.]
MTRTTSRPFSQRQLRVGAEIQHALAWILERGEVHDPGLVGRTLTVTEVQMSPDLRHARVFVVPQSSGDATEGVIAALSHARTFLRRRLGEEVRLRFSPELSFAPDRSFETADRIEHLLREPAVARDLAKPQETAGGHNDDR